MSTSLPQRTGLLAGPFLFLLLWLLPAPEGLSKAGMMVGAGTLWMAIWWLTEAVPMYVTALLPMVLYPISGAVDVKELGSAYGSWLVWLVFCGFALAAAIERWNLHRRLALRIIMATGTAPDRIIMGFMLATGFLSMWISNTASTVMMMPIGLAVATTLSGAPGGDDDNFGKSLMLAIAYSASIGGMTSLIGTPTNLIFANAAADLFQVEITFQKWIKIGLPIGIILLAFTWFYLTRIAFSFGDVSGKAGREVIVERYRALGAASTAEKRVGIVFTLVALAWIGRSFLKANFFPLLNDTTIGLIGVIALFIIPAGRKRDEATQQTILDWPTVQKIPWGVMILIGGGLAIAKAFTATDLATWIGGQLESLNALPFLLLLLIIVALVNFLTEITSNMATTSILMPILAVTATAIGVDPLVLMASATLAAGCAFMLPIATAPNAVVFGSGYLGMSDMARTGLALNLFSIGVIGLLGYFYLPLVW